LAAEIKDRFGVETEIQPGSKGSFEVSLDGKLLFSKLKEHRFPEADEIFSKVDGGR
jgi:selT/selW/selH-like putative selenoprotein